MVLVPEDRERALVARPSGVESKYNERGPVFRLTQFRLLSHVTPAAIVKPFTHIINP